MAVLLQQKRSKQFFCVTTLHNMLSSRYLSNTQSKIVECVVIGCDPITKLCILAMKCENQGVRLALVANNPQQKYSEM